MDLDAAESNSAAARARMREEIDFDSIPHLTDANNSDSGEEDMDEAAECPTSTFDQIHLPKRRLNRRLAELQNENGFWEIWKPEIIRNLIERNGRLLGNCACGLAADVFCYDCRRTFCDMCAIQYHHEAFAHQVCKFIPGVGRHPANRSITWACGCDTCDSVPMIAIELIDLFGIFILLTIACQIVHVRPCKHSISYMLANDFFPSVRGRTVKCGFSFRLLRLFQSLQLEAAVTHLQFVNVLKGI
jgi:hypothetical protein